MDVVLGVAVTGPIARLALVGTGADATGVIDQSVVDLANNPIEQLLETVVGTNRLLAGEHHRLVGTRVCWTDHPQADQLRRALEDSGVHNVAVLSESQAVKALMRAAGRPGSALLFDEATATLSLVDSAEADDDAPPTLLASGPVTGDETAALDTMMARLGEAPNAPQDVLLVGASGDLDRVAEQLRETSTMRVQIPEDPTFALARGAAMAAAPLAPDATAMAPAVGLTGDETAMAPAAGLDPDATTIVPADAQAADAQLAYSLAEDGGELPPRRPGRVRRILRFRSRNRPAEAEPAIVAGGQRGHRVRGDRVGLAGRRGRRRRSADRERGTRGGTPERRPG